MFCETLLDDWGLAPFSEENRRDLLEMVEDRHDRRATIITSQLPVEHWHDALGDPTLADAILAAWCIMPTRSPCMGNRCANGRPS